MWSVSNAQVIYKNLRTYFSTRLDKLFIMIIALTLGGIGYTAGDLSADQQSSNTRAFKKELMFDWLADYPYQNVAVFDYYDVLTSNGSD